MERHYDTLVTWWNHWEGDAIHPALLPKHGYIIPNKAAGFLYRTDSMIALLENFVVAPGCRGTERREAMKEVALQLKKKANELGHVILFGYTCVPTMVHRMEDIGFEKVNEKFTCLVWE